MRKGSCADEIAAVLLHDLLGRVREAPRAGLADARDARVGGDAHDVVGAEQIAPDEQALDLLDLHPHTPMLGRSSERDLGALRPEAESSSGRTAGDAPRSDARSRSGAAVTARRDHGRRTPRGRAGLQPPVAGRPMSPTRSLPGWRPSPTSATSSSTDPRAGMSHRHRIPRRDRRLIAALGDAAALDRVPRRAAHHGRDHGRLPRPAVRRGAGGRPLRAAHRCRGGLGAGRQDGGHHQRLVLRRLGVGAGDGPDRAAQCRCVVPQDRHRPAGAVPPRAAARTSASATGS